MSRNLITSQSSGAPKMMPIGSFLLAAQSLFAVTQIQALLSVKLVYLTIGLALARKFLRYKAVGSKSGSGS